MNNPKFICDILNDEAKETLDFDQPVDQGDLEDSDFDIDDTFTDEELKKRKSRAYRLKQDKQLLNTGAAVKK